MKKLITLIAALAIMAVPAFGQQVNRFTMEFQDMWGEAVTGLTSINVQDAGTGDSSTIYSDRARTNQITNPIVTGLGRGRIAFWLNAASYKITVTDGTNSITVDDLTGSVSSMPWWDSYMSTQSGLTLNDSQAIVLGSDADWSGQSASSTVLTWTPLVDNSAFNIGLSGTSKNSDFNVFVGTALGLKLDAGDPSFTWDGGAALLNHNSNFNVGINTGTSTGITSIGSSTAGGFAVDTDAGITINADDSYALTVSAGTISIAATGGDITIDGVDSSLILRGSEAVADAVVIDADAGGVDISAAATFDIDITATGGRVLVIASEAAADQFKVDATGTVADYAIVFETTNGGIQLNADDASNGDIDIDAADNITITAAGDLIYAVTGTIEGGGSTVNNFYRTVEVVSGTSDTLTASQSGSMIVYTQTGGACTVTLPEATSGTVGMWFILVDANVTAGRDLVIDPEGVGTINGDAAGDSITNVIDQDGEGVLIFSTAADVWYTVFYSSSTVWTEQ